MLRPKFDSTFFVAFKLTHEALDAALKKASELNITQYRVLVKLLTAGTAGLPQKDVSALLDLKPNVVTQAINTLEERGLALRANGATDKRFRRARATSAGGEHAARVNAAIVEELYDLFPTDNAAWRKILEASIAAGADIDPPLSPDFAEKYPASRTLVSIELVRLAIERGLKETCGAPLSDCLVMMRLGEATRPLRVNDIGESLEMPTANVTRAVDRLVQRGWVKRMEPKRARSQGRLCRAHRRWGIPGTHYQRKIKRARRGTSFEQAYASRPGSHRRCGSVVIDGLRRRRAEERNVVLPTCGRSTRRKEAQPKSCAVQNLLWHADRSD